MRIWPSGNALNTIIRDIAVHGVKAQGMSMRVYSLLVEQHRRGYRQHDPLLVLDAWGVHHWEQAFRRKRTSRSSA